MNREKKEKKPIEEKRNAGMKHRITKRPFLLLLCVFPELEINKHTKTNCLVHEIAALSVEPHFFADRNALQQRRQERLQSHSLANPTLEEEEAISEVTMSSHFASAYRTFCRR